MPPRPARAAFTIIEVMVAAALVGLATGSIMTMNSQSLRTLKNSHLAAASSQMLQQRVEQLRARPWAEVSSSAALARLFAPAVESEPEMSAVQVQEIWQVAATANPVNPDAPGRAFRVRRAAGLVTIEAADDLGAETTLVVDGRLTWRDGSVLRQRALRTVICRAGLTRAGIFGSGLGRPASAAP